ncbi:hypothetical protein ONZ45_g5982 [Pleurotus djamor]|nr:hypothetical protein ONZ45_g5982 [Pleurotus djamor]
MNTMQLSNMLLSPRSTQEYGSLPSLPPRGPVTERRFSENTSKPAISGDSFIFPTPATTPSTSALDDLPPTPRAPAHHATAPVLPTVHTTSTPAQHVTQATATPSRSSTAKSRPCGSQSAEVLPSTTSTTPTSQRASIPASNFVPVDPSSRGRVPRSNLSRPSTQSSSLSSLDFSTDTEANEPRISYTSSLSQTPGYPSTLSFFDSEGSDPEVDDDGRDDLGKTPTQHRMQLDDTPAPSGLSLLLRSYSAERGEDTGKRAREGVARGEGFKVNAGLPSDAPPTITFSPPSASLASFDRSSGFLSTSRPFDKVQRGENVDERVPLLSGASDNYIPNSYSQYDSIPQLPSRSHSTSNHHSPATKGSSFGRISYYIERGLRETCKEENWRLAAKALPGVLLGCLLNVLDGVSFVYTFGGSGFKGANGSMMIEVVPFFHILATSIAEQIGEDHPKEVIATTLVAYALSSVLTGLAFFLLGALRLGVIIGFFPRHILVGCIGGVGAFLILTGLTVSTRLPDDDFAFDLETLRWRGDMVFPAYFLIIPTLFYTVVLAARFDLDTLRHSGWLFDVGTGSGASNLKWYSFYSYLDYRLVHFAPLWNTLPTQFALLFFNILHPPLNVPALSVSLNEDIDTNKELVGHGYSNLLAGLLGTVPNYLVYVNTLLFYRVGGNTRIASFLLAIATAFLLFIGTGPIAFIPVMVVGALIFVLGLDLVKEALWDARHRASRTEYITIISIMICMTAWDFVIGVLFGIVMSCFFFVIQNSQVPSIRALRSGETAMSSVRRPSSQRDYLREVSKQTTVMHLQGFLFFGTIVSVEDCIRDIIEGASWQRNPVRFLVLDLSLVAGIDMSAAEAFVRVHRLVATKHVILVFSGFDEKDEVGKALQTVEVLGADGVELFETLNDALEWTENAYLRAWFRAHKTELAIHALPGRREADVLNPHSQSFAASPRYSHLHDAGNRTIAKAQDFQSHLGDDLNLHEYAEPFDALVKAFSSYGEISLEQFQPLLALLQRISVPEGHVLWKQNESPDGIYIIHSGVLRASYDFGDHTPTLAESMVAGTLAGELTALSDTPRNATVAAERPSILWRLSMSNMRDLEKHHSALFGRFFAKVDYDILLSSIATRT